MGTISNYNRKTHNYMKTSGSIPRRRFLKNVAIAAATPLILPSNVWSAATAPSEQIRLGHIGIGTQGRGLLSGFLGRNDTRVVAVCDVDTDRRENAKSMVHQRYAEAMTSGTYKGCDTYNDFRELLRAGLHCRRQREKGHLLRKAHGPHHSRGAGHGQRRARQPARLPMRQH